jgi:integrase
MAKRIKTKFVGVRYREHPTRKHGIRPDRYFTIRYKLNGKDKEEVLGWSSQGVTAQIANARLSEIKENQRTGQGAQSLTEKRNLLKAKRKKEQADQERQAKENISFSSYFTDIYFSIAQTSKKQKSFEREVTYFKLWIEPVFRDLPFKDIAPFHCEKIKKNMLDAGKAPRTLQYCFATIRQVWNMAKRDGLLSAESPTKQVSIPKIDNKRLRFLSHDEADILLERLAKLSIQLHDEALLSLHCGLRAGEIFKLTWKDVDLEHGLLTLRDAKSGTRTAYMTESVKNILKGRKPFAENKLVFPEHTGGKQKQVSNSFRRVVKRLGFNDGIIDRRQRLVFHSLRHTFASWHVQSGTDLYTVQKLMGHSSFAMVQRYAHLSEGTLQKAVKNLEESMSTKNNVVELQQN